MGEFIQITIGIITTHFIAEQVSITDTIGILLTILIIVIRLIISIIIILLIIMEITTQIMDTILIAIHHITIITPIVTIIMLTSLGIEVVYHQMVEEEGLM